MTETCDALVLGGGPAGATAALLLSRAGWSVTVIERKAFPRRKVCGEYLSGTNRPLFDELGLLDIFDELAGPDVTRVGLYAGDAELTSKLPRPATGWGRALSRDRLDPLLLDRACLAGATIVQPCTAETLERDSNGWVCRARAHGEFRAPVVIAAHGSWHSGRLPTLPAPRRPRASDLFGFKAHYRDAALPSGLMPLLAFPGGYGGMVHTDAGLVSISCCVRRDQLAQLRSGTTWEAGPAVGTHIIASCAGVRRALESATLVDRWLAAGPIRPGTRLSWPPGIFAVGNAAGEAHPIVAEGISMAMQSAWLLARRLIRNDANVAERYARDWRRAFGRRLLAASALARWAMSPAALALSLPIVGRFPALLTWGALASGKATRVVRSRATR